MSGSPCDVRGLRVPLRSISQPINNFIKAALACLVAEHPLSVFFSMAGHCLARINSVHRDRAKAAHNSNFMQTFVAAFREHNLTDHGLSIFDIDRYWHQRHLDTAHIKKGFLLRQGKVWSANIVHLRQQQPQQGREIQHHIKAPAIKRGRK